MTVDVEEASPTETWQAAGAVRWDLFALAGTTLLFVLLQYLLFAIPRFHFGVDESVYLSQVIPGEPADWMDVHRARGTSLLAAPVSWFLGYSTLWMRTWFILLSALGLYFGFRPWVRLTGWVGSVAAFLFAMFWGTLLFGAQIFPNMYAAVGGIGAAGHVLVYLSEGKRRDLVFAAAWLALVALVRPLDSVLVAFGVWVGVIILQRRAFLPVTLALAAGGLAGFLPFFAEGFVRFGLDPFTLVFAAQESGATGVNVPNLAVYADRVTGDVRCAYDCKVAFLRDPSTRASKAEWLSVAVVAVGAAIGALLAIRKRMAPGILAALVTATLLAYYLTCSCAINLRYLLPALAFLAILLAVGLVELWQRFGRRLGLIGIVVVALLALVYVGRMSFLGWREHQSDAWRERARNLAVEVDDYAGDAPCLVGAYALEEPLQLYSHCTVAFIRSTRESPFLVRRGDRTPYDLDELRAQGYRVFAVARPVELPDAAVISEWPSTEVDLPGGGTYLFFEEGDVDAAG